MELFVRQLVNGLALGSIYSLVAIGFAMVYGILFFINFPHGEILMMGMYIALILMGQLGVPFVITLPLAMLLTALLGMSVEKIAYSRLRTVRRLAPLLSAMGVSLAFQNLALVIWGAKPLPYPVPDALRGEGLMVVGIQIPRSLILIFALTIVLMIGLQVFFKRHIVGIAIRAVSQNQTSAKLVGVNPNLEISATFAIGSALAAAGGLLLGVRYGSVYPTVGFSLMLKAFAACVLGGIGSIPGAVVGGMIIGITETFAVGYISSAYRDAIAFAVLTLVLLVRPSGLLGGRTEAIV
jgi:branched-chain amino acid transport system permease protein